MFGRVLCNLWSVSKVFCKGNERCLENFCVTYEVFGKLKKNRLCHVFFVTLWKKFLNLSETDKFWIKFFILIYLINCCNRCNFHTNTNKRKKLALGNQLVVDRWRGPNWVGMDINTGCCRPGFVVRCNNRTRRIRS